MSAYGRSMAELAQTNLGFAPPLRLTFGLLNAIVAVALAVGLDAPYWYWAILPAILLSLKLSRNEVATRLYALLDSQGGLFTDGTHFYGVLGGWLVHGERTLPQVAFAEYLLTANAGDDAKPSIYDRRAPIGFRCWRISDLQGIEFDSDKPKIRLNLKADTQSFDLSDTKQRDRLVSQLVAGDSWQSDSQASWRFAPQLVSLLFFVVPIIAFGACTVACAAEWVQVADLPLVEWGDVKGRRRVKGFLVLAAAFSSFFLFLNDNVPALPRSAIGTVVVGAGVVLAYYSCVFKFKKITWTRRSAR